MPANLNALIRYKTINNCLFGGRRRWSIDELTEACSGALAESRGRYDAVSERTIRDDLRVMKSDILGFNAPIVQENGCYFYSDPHYSILSLRITDAGLADRIFSLLLSLRQDVAHPELESILEQLSELTGKRYEKPAEAGKFHISIESEKSCINLQSESSLPPVTVIDYCKSKILSVDEKFSRKRDSLFEKPSEQMPEATMDDSAGEGLSWGYILGKLVGLQGIGGQR